MLFDTDKELVELVRVSKAAQLLDTSRKRIYLLIQEGKLEAIKLGPRQTRILKRSLDAYLDRLRIFRLKHSGGENRRKIALSKMN